MSCSHPRAAAFARALLLLATLPSVFAEGMALLVPAYFQPDAVRWPALATAAGRVPLVVIANVFNGPGSERSSRYVAALTNVRNAGGEVIGYVYTQYTNRPLDVVKADMRRWHEFYPLDGFFVDEMANQPSQVALGYYSELLRYARELHPDYRLIGNPGTNTDESYLKRPTADAVVIFENRAGYATFTPAAWTRRYPAHQFAHLAYSISSTEQLTNYLNLAVSRRAGFMYVTDDGGNNPWDTLPTYWETEVNLVEAINHAAAERVRSDLTVGLGAGATMVLSAQGATGRYVLEAASPLGEWRPLSTNLTNTGASVWQVLNLPPNRFFRLRQD